MTRFDIAGSGFGPVASTEVPHGYPPSPQFAGGFTWPAPTLKDSGERQTFETGAVRDSGSGKGRFDLLPVHGLLLAAQQMEAGALKYAARNWEKGMPLSEFADSADRHIKKLLAGYDDEPHLAAAIWNLLCLAEGKERVRQGIWPAHLDDLPTTYAGKEPPF